MYQIIIGIIICFYTNGSVLFNNNNNNDHNYKFHLQSPKVFTTQANTFLLYIYIYIYIFHFPNKIEMAFNMVLTKLLHFPNSMNLNIKDNKIKNTWHEYKYKR